MTRDEQRAALQKIVDAITDAAKGCREALGTPAYYTPSFSFGVMPPASFALVCDVLGVAPEDVEHSFTFQGGTVPHVIHYIGGAPYKGVTFSGQTNAQPVTVAPLAQAEAEAEATP